MRRRQQGPPKPWQTSTRQHGATTQNSHLRTHRPQILQNNIKADINEVVCGDVEMIQLPHDSIRLRAPVKEAMNLLIQLLKEDYLSSLKLRNHICISACSATSQVCYITSC
jgi:hypothetical protein